MSNAIEQVTQAAEIGIAWRNAAAQLPQAPEIQDQATHDSWAHYLREIATLLGQLEDQRKSMTAPLNKAKKAVDDHFRPAKSALEKCQQQIRARLSQYATRIAAENRAAAAAAFEARTAGDFNAALQVAPMQSTPETVGVRYQERWEFALSSGSGNAFGMVPDAFKMLDDSKIRAYLATCKAAGTDPIIPGITFTKVSTPVVGKL